MAAWRTGTKGNGEGVGGTKAVGVVTWGEDVWDFLAVGVGDIRT